MSISAAKSIKKAQRLATISDLERLEYTNFQLAGTGGLNARARRWLFFLVALARLGYTGIKAPMWAIVKAQFRAGGGQTFSESTAYRALKDLEQLGYIRRIKFRVGRDRFYVHTHFAMEKFTYWLQRAPHIAPVTSSHTPLQLSLCLGNNVTSKGSLVNSPNSLGNKIDKPARATTSNKGSGFSKPSKAQREDPRVYTARIVTRGYGKSRRRLILARIILELGAPKLRTSGIDWERWDEKTWLEMTIPEREAVARDQIIPYIEYMRPVEKIDGHIKRIFKQAARRPVDSKPFRQTAQATPEKVKEMLKAAGLDQSLQIDTADEPKPGPPPPPSLTPGDIEILKAARLRVAKKADYP